MVLLLDVPVDVSEAAIPTIVRASTGSATDLGGAHAVADGCSSANTSTVADHLRSVFAEVGVSARGELTSRLSTTSPSEGGLRQPGRASTGGSSRGEAMVLPVAGDAGWWPMLRQRPDRADGRVMGRMVGPCGMATVPRTRKPRRWYARTLRMVELSR